MKKLLLFLLCMNIFASSASASIDSAYEYILMDMTTGRILDGKNYNTPMLIASITKIMTCVLAIESNKLDDMVLVDDTILDSFGSGIYIKVGEEIKLKDLLYGLMLRSGNDAALMIAKYVSGDVSSFVKNMNSKAYEIGMKNTVFNNPSGLDEVDAGNYSTAYDMALLTRYAMNSSVYREIVKTKKYSLKTNKNSYIWHNKNKLLNYDYITGGKTGYTNKARRTLVSTARFNNMEFIVVTIKDSDDWNTHISLYNYARDNYYGYKVLNKNKFRVIGDDYYNSTFYIKNNIYIPLKKEETGNLISKIKLKKLKEYKKDTMVGYDYIYLNDLLLYKEPIYIDRINKKRNIF